MQLESTYPKYAGRVPPLDLSQVNTNCRTENEMHHHMWSNKSNGNSNVNTTTTTSSSSAKRNALHHHPYQLHTPTSMENNSNSLTTTINSNNNHMSNNNNNNNNNNVNKNDNKSPRLGADGLPLDPRDWTRADVWKWLVMLSSKEGLEVTPELPQKFPMNGKALCLMSLDMYVCRVPVGGKMLYRDFRVRLARAMTLYS